MHFDLSIPVDSADALRGDELARIREMISTARRLGYSCVALDYRARLPLRPNDMCRLQCSALSADASPPPIIDDVAARLSASAPAREFSALLSKRDAARVAFAAARVGTSSSHKRRREAGGAARVELAPKPSAHPFVVSRITIVLESEAEGGRFAHARAATALTSPLLSAWDVIAVEPSDAGGLEVASRRADIVSLDVSAARLAFPLLPAAAAAAVAHGAAFELRYAPAIRDASARRFFISGARAVLAVTRGHGILLSSGARTALELRSPRDAAAIARLGGLSLEKALLACSSVAAGVVAHARVRANGGVEEIASAARPEVT